MFYPCCWLQNEGDPCFPSANSDFHDFKYGNMVSVPSLVSVALKTESRSVLGFIGQIKHRALLEQLGADLIEEPSTCKTGARNSLGPPTMLLCKTSWK